MFCPALVEIAVAWVKATEKNAYLSKWVASMHTLPTQSLNFIYSQILWSFTTAA